MKFRVTYKLTIEVEADDASKAEEKAGEIDFADMDSKLINVLEVFGD